MSLQITINNPFTEGNAQAFVKPTKLTKVDVATGVGEVELCIWYTEADFNAGEKPIYIVKTDIDMGSLVSQVESLMDGITVSYDEINSSQITSN